VDAPARKSRQDPQPMRVRERAEDADELVAGQVLEVKGTLVFHV
jgi:hypothetical protein